MFEAATEHDIGLDKLTQLHPQSHQSLLEARPTRQVRRLQVSEVLQLFAAMVVQLYDKNNVNK